MNIKESDTLRFGVSDIISGISLERWLSFTFTSAETLHLLSKKIINLASLCMSFRLFYSLMNYDACVAFS